MTRSANVPSRRAHFSGASLTALAIIAPALLVSRGAWATPYNATKDTGTIIPPEAKNVTVDERLGTPVPTDLRFIDESGKAIALGQYFDKSRKPVVLQLGYFGCPMLCDMISQRLVESLGKVELTAGKDFEVLYVSFDPQETAQLAARKKSSLTKEYGRGDAGAAGFHFLTGSADQIQKLADAVGYQFKWVVQANQYSHPAVLILLMPDGRVSRYLYWPRFDPQTLRLSLVEASDRKIGSTADKFLLTCFRYDGTHGRYALVAVRVMQIGGAVVAVTLGTILALAFRWEAKRRARERQEEETETATEKPAG
jgi:protein SCO1/2